MERYIQSTQPDAILLLAVVSNTGFCEEHPEESNLVNVVGVENLAKAAQKHGIKMVWFSSDQIYNGNDELGLLKEDMDIAPENHLGRHKLLAEQKSTGSMSKQHSTAIDMDVQRSYTRQGNT